MDIELIQGDCLTVMDDLISKGVKVDCLITDPPYGMTACNWDKLVDFKLFWERVSKVCKEDSNIIIFSKQPFTTLLNNSNINDYRYEIIWKKQQATNPMCAKQRIMPIHENISIFYKKRGVYNPQMRQGFSNYSSFKDDSKQIGEIYGLKSCHRDCSDGSRYPVSVLEFNNVRKGLHPTQKPLGLLEYLVKTFTNSSQTVLDPFMGSGTTGIACKQLERNFIGIELDDNYFKTAKDRILGETNDSN